MSLNYEELPDSVKQRLNKIAEIMNKDIHHVFEMFLQVLQSPTVQAVVSKMSPEKGLEYAARVLYVRVVSQPEGKEYIIVPFGIGAVTQSRSNPNTPLCRVYVMWKEPETGMKGTAVVVARDEAVDMFVENVECFHMYKVKLVYVNESLFLASARSVPELIDTVAVSDYEKFYIEKFNARKITISEIPHNLSRTREGGFVDDLDLRIVQGIIVRCNRVTKGVKRLGILEISDDTAPPQPVQLDDGTVITPTLVCWTHPKFIRYAPDSEVAVVGSIRKTPRNVPMMNAIFVIPINVIPL